MRSNGNSYDRRRRREWLCGQFTVGGQLICGICRCPIEGDEWDVDRIVPGARGGRYVRGNIRPSHVKCNRGRDSARELELDRSFRDGMIAYYKGFMR